MREGGSVTESGNERGLVERIPARLAAMVPVVMRSDYGDCFGDGGDCGDSSGDAVGLE
ncbi:hypothetical protein A2U01_0052257 [Trifolium medium]|uniref:Uncharacterized protein n=1 Tax=Trifolium medium TaxID=97028 RepID=A0A392R5D0_9FABA|nr:hypothetical protein [Trifolium medium]